MLIYNTKAKVAKTADALAQIKAMAPSGIWVYDTLHHHMQNIKQMPFTRNVLDEDLLIFLNLAFEYMPF